jgi:hypothetical protein
MGMGLAGLILLFFAPVLVGLSGIVVWLYLDFDSWLTQRESDRRWEADKRRARFWRNYYGG